MNEEFKYTVHEYTYVSHSGKLEYRYHETNFAKKTIRELVKSDPFNNTKVLLVLNGVENEEEAYVFSERAMMRVFSYDAIKAVEIIACLPFYQYSRSSIIAQLTEYMYREFQSRPDENELTF